ILLRGAGTNITYFCSSPLSGKLVRLQPPTAREKRTHIDTTSPLPFLEYLARPLPPPPPLLWFVTFHLSLAN
ncbi:unnamed protein product, partial [Ectocarpus sp. 13 AM-2016]